MMLTAFERRHHPRRLGQPRRRRPDRPAKGTSASGRRRRGFTRAAPEVLADTAAGVLAPWADPDSLFDLVLGSYLAHVVRRSASDEQWRRRTVALLSRLVTEPAPPG